MTIEKKLSAIADGVELYKSQNEALQNDLNDLKESVSDLQAKGFRALALDEVAKEKPTDFKIKQWIESGSSDYSTFVKSQHTGNASAVLDDEINTSIIESAIDNEELLKLGTDITAKTRDYYRLALNGRPNIAYGSENTDLTNPAETQPVDVKRHSSTWAKGYAMVAYSDELKNEAASSLNFDINSNTIRLIGEQYSQHAVSEFLFGDGTTDRIRGLVRGAVDYANTFTEALKPDATRDSETFQIHKTGVNGGLPSSATEILDFLIDVQSSVKGRYQESAVWIMSRNTLAALAKVRDSENRPLIVKHYQEQGVGGATTGYMVLGKPVRIIDQMEDFDVTNGVCIGYGDFDSAYEKHLALHEKLILDEYTVKGSEIIYYQSWCGLTIADNTAIRFVASAV